MLPAGKYWGRFLLYLTLGALAGLVVGSFVQSATAVAGWTVTLATVGTVAGALLFMLRRDT